MLAPLLDGAAQAVLFTSANGVRAFAAAIAAARSSGLRGRRRHRRCGARGGFADVASAGGDVEDLARLVRAAPQARGRRAVHAAAQDVAGDLAGALGAAGFEVRRAVLYEAVPAERLSAATAAQLRAGAIAAAIFFSPRTARRLLGSRAPPGSTARAAPSRPLR